MKGLFGVALVLFIAFNARAQAGLSVSPMKLVFDRPDGQISQQRIIVSNPSTGEVQVGVQIADWKRDSLGTIRYAWAGSLGHSCSDWIKVLPSMAFTLAPHEQKEVTVLLDIPRKHNDTTHNAMVFFTQLNAMNGGPRKNGLAIKLTVKVGVQVFYHPPSFSVKEIEIADFQDKMQYDKDSLGIRTLLLTLKNKGNRETDGKVQWELNNLETGAKISLSKKPFYTLPGAVFIVKGSLPGDLQTGTYSAVAMVDYGPQYELKVGELHFRVE